MKLQIAAGFSLPFDAVTQTFAILGIRGSGKTNTGVVLAEELLRAKQQVVIIDPVDVWWGLKSARSGKAPGYAVPVIGGEHADVPLDGAAGAVLADFVVETQASVILSLRHLSMTDQRRFAGDFAKRLYERKGVAAHRSPLMLIVDEADEFVPQRITHGHEALFGAFDRLVRRGRSSGIGVTLISQRAQVLNKDVLSQMETLIGMRVLHKLDRNALEAWIEAHDTEGRRDDFLSSLASLERGEAWIWSPSWLGAFQRVRIRARHTFDSSATPKAGERLLAPKELAPLDLDQLRERMAATIEKVKADDPRALRAEVARLRAKVEAAEKNPAASLTALSEAEARGYALGRAEGRAEFDWLADSWAGAHELLKNADEKMAEAFLSLISRRSTPKAPTLKVPAKLPTAPASASSPPAPSSSGRTARVEPGRGSGEIPKGELAILTACTQLPEGATPQALTQLTGYKRSSRDAYIQRLLGRGLIDRRDGVILPTAAGIAALGSSYQPLPTGRDLQAYWLERLPEGERRILAHLLAIGGARVHRDALSDVTGYQRSSRDAYIQRLKARQLVETPSAGTVEAALIFFDTRGAGA
jgi:hypothetical protein